MFGLGPRVPFAPSRVGKRGRAALKKAKVQRISLPECRHTCRHTFASLLIAGGVNPKAIQTFMGHATIQMAFDQYGHPIPGSRDQARELVDAYLAASCASDASVASVAEQFTAAGAEEHRAANPPS